VFDQLIPEAENQTLLSNWYDFNDGNVTAIYPGNLMKQFGGSSETAYMLVYRLKRLNAAIPDLKIPYYWEAPIATTNELGETSRNLYSAM
jgi:hypothetical protein